MQQEHQEPNLSLWLIPHVFFLLLPWNSSTWFHVLGERERERARILILQVHESKTGRKQRKEGSTLVIASFVVLGANILLISFGTRSWSQVCLCPIPGTTDATRALGTWENVVNAHSTSWFKRKGNRLPYSGLYQQDTCLSLILKYRLQYDAARYLNHVAGSLSIVGLQWTYDASMSIMILITCNMMNF